MFWRDAAVYLTTALSRFDIAQNFDPWCMLPTLYQPITRNPFRSLVDKGLVEGIQAADRSLPKSMKILPSSFIGYNGCFGFKIIFFKRDFATFSLKIETIRYTIRPRLRLQLRFSDILSPRWNWIFFDLNRKGLLIRLNRQFCFDVSTLI